VGRERRLRPGSREPRAREAKADSADLAYLRTTAVWSARPALRRGCPGGLEADREMAGRVRPRLGWNLGQGQGPVRRPDRRQVAEDLGQKPPRGTPGNWHPI